MTPSPDLDDDVSTIHSACPFCSGDYSIAASHIRHSIPVCAKWQELPCEAFLDAARAAQTRKDATPAAKR